MEYNENSYYPGQSPDEGQPKRKKPQNRGLRKLLWLVPVILIIAGLAMDSFYTLTEDQYAVITTFGKPTTVSASGLQMKIPLVQRVSLVSKSIQGFPLGYRAGSDESVDDESLMITYDYNFVNVDFYVEYRVTDPVKYLYNSNDPVGILKMLCQSYIRDTIGLYDVDSVITTGKSEIQADIKQKIVERLETEDLGIQLTNITIQDAEPPTPEVQQAFTAVETAKQGADTAVNNAKKYGANVILCREIKKNGWEASIKKAIELASKDTEVMYVTICADSLDAAFMPQGPQDMGGLTSFELLMMVHEAGLAGARALDFVEIYPDAYSLQPASHVGCWLALYFLNGVAERRKNGGK